MATPCCAAVTSWRKSAPAERESWLFCFRKALEETVAHPTLQEIIWQPVERLAHHMQNKE